jgi:hypothetical protein
MAANIAIGLMVLGWLASFWGLFSQLGDPDPRVPRAVIEAENRTYFTLFLGGVASIVVAMWLAGFGYSEAKVRALIVAAFTVIPIVAIGVWVAIGY